MPKPLCVSCQRFYRPKRNGTYVAEMMPSKPGALPGLMEPKLWVPYKVWVADLWECKGCGHELISGYAYQPTAEKHSPDFERWMAMTTVVVNDC